MASGIKADGVAAAARDPADVLAPDEVRKREKFLPVTRFALLDRLTRTHVWPEGKAREARRFFKYLDYWRRQQYGARVLALEQFYEPFNPDSDLLVTRKFTDAERGRLQKEVVTGVRKLLVQANYVAIDPTDVAQILTRDSAYGLDLSVDLDEFEELLIYYRGASNRKDQRRYPHKFWRKQEFDVPIFRRLMVLFKLKPRARRVEEVMRKRRCDRREAERVVTRTRGMIPASVKVDSIYMKLFKNMPRADIEMIFPNTKVRFRLLDKLKLGVSGGAGVGVGLFSAAGKIAVVASNPIAAAGAVAGLGGIAFRQAVNFLNQRQKYMVVMAQNLYFHAMADNRGVMVKLADRAAEEDIKEEMLLYSVLAKETVKRSDLTAVDQAIEEFLSKSFGLVVDFDINDALERLLADGIVTESAEGVLVALQPKQAALHIDAKWDTFLDDLPEPGPTEVGEEYDDERAAEQAGA